MRIEVLKKHCRRRFSSPYTNRISWNRILLPGLTALDAKLGQSKQVRKVAPIKLVSTGGFVAVTYFGNRETTHDIDCMIDPQLSNPKKINPRLHEAIDSVSEDFDFIHDWMNTLIDAFIDQGFAKTQLFHDSIQQNVVLWRGENLVVYAADWGWSLGKKLKRIVRLKKPTDISDAVELVKRLVDSKDGRQADPREVLKTFSTDSPHPNEDEAFDIIAAGFQEKYGAVEIPSTSALEDQDGAQSGSCG